MVGHLADGAYTQWTRREAWKQAHSGLGRAAFGVAAVTEVHSLGRGLDLGRRGR